MAEFEISELNRQQRRSMSHTKPMQASALKIMRWGDKVAIGIEQPGYVELTQVEAVQLADSLLGLAGQTTSD